MSTIARVTGALISRPTTATPPARLVLVLIAAYSPREVAFEPRKNPWVLRREAETLLSTH